MTNTEIVDCTTCKYGYEDERLGIPMCHHPKRFSEDCVDFNMHEEKHLEDETNNSLDEAAEEYALDVKAKPYGNLVKDAFKDGAEWQKTQMMKDAVEGTVHNFSSNKPHPTVLVDAKGFNQGDKVHIIIVKEG